MSRACHTDRIAAARARFAQGEPLAAVRRHLVDTFGIATSTAYRDCRAAQPDTPPASTGGQPTKLTPATVRTICEAVAKGAHIKHACEAAGISYSTHFGWLKRGEREGEGEYFQYFKVLARAEAELANSLTALIDTACTAADTDPAFILRWLQVRFPRQFGKQIAEVEVVHSVADEVPDALLMEIAQRRGVEP